MEKKKKPHPVLDKEAFRNVDPPKVKKVTKAKPDKKRISNSFTEDEVNFLYEIFNGKKRHQFSKEVLENVLPSLYAKIKRMKTKIESQDWASDKWSR